MMGKQNMFVSDRESSVNMSIMVAAAMSNPSLFTISGDKLAQNIEISGAATLSSWIDSMRASSPTHVKSAHSNFKDQPSALEMFEQITNASKGKLIVMFLDYDGTLSPIVDDPDKAFMSDAMRATVRKLARYFPTAIVSGRCRDKVYSFVRLAELYYAGSHGMDIKGPSKGSKNTCGSQAILFQPATEFLPMINKVHKTLVGKTKSTPGAKVEHNKFCVSVHFRCVDEMKWSELLLQVRSVLRKYPKLQLTQGRKVLEIRPIIQWDKGKALEFLLESLGLADCKDVFPVYIGDDRSDEDAFRVLRDRGQGVGILVSKTPKDTNASYYLREPSEARKLVDLRISWMVMEFLQQLANWERQQLTVQKRLEEVKIAMPSSQML
ncbi:Trehalose-phosphatase [Bertholletia excelsa]